MGHPSSYILQERLTFLAKYDRLTKEYSCALMEREDGFWKPEDIDDIRLKPIQ